MRCSWRRNLTAWIVAALVIVGGARLEAQEPEASPSDGYFVPEPVPERNDYDQLLERLRAAEARIQSLEATVPRDPNTTEERISALERITAPPPEKFPSVRLSGFFHLDAGYFGQDAANRADLGDIQDGVGFRRARLQALGKVSEFTAYSLEMDFAIAGHPSFMDVWGEQQEIPVLGNVRIGHFRPATSMDTLTPIRQLTFLERSLPFQAFDPLRRVGVMAYDKSDNEMWSWAYGAFKTGGFLESPLGDSRFATDIGDQGGYSVAGRLTHLLYYDEGSEGRYLLHVGGHYDYSRITAGASTSVPLYEARSIPEFFVGDIGGGGLTSAGTPFFLDTGRLAAESFNYYGLQLAGHYGAAHFQAEYLATSVNQIGNPNVFYEGAYAQTGYFLTGENRTYNRTFGVFDRITPYTDFFTLGRQGGFCGWGAWEITGRWSYLNLSDPNAVPVATVASTPRVPNPGQLNESTVGLNWYWNAYSKLQFNWMHCFLDTDIGGKSDCDIFATRFQVEF